MVLMACPECGDQVSSVARACPKCGHPVAYFDRTTRIGLCLAIAMFAAAAGWMLVNQAVLAT